MASRVWNFFAGAVGFAPTQSRPFNEQGVTGVQSAGGFIVSGERNAKLTGDQKYVTLNNVAVNTSIVAASIRYYMALVTKGNWTVEPANDSDEAKRAAELVEISMDEMDLSFSRVIRRAASFRFIGFSAQEWKAKRRADGKIIYATIANRPQSTIKQWDLDKQGNVLGVVQRNYGMAGGETFYVPRSKLIYLVDDMFTDNPEGLGVLRHMVEPAARLETYQRLEQQGFERDLRGVPVGKAPYRAVMEAVKSGQITQEQGTSLLRPIEEFVQMQVKGSSTGLVHDSQPYVSQGESGSNVSAVSQYSMELLNGSAPGLEYMAPTIQRYNLEMARIMGTEGLLLGGNSSGSFALSQDKTSSLLMSINSTVNDIADQMNMDYLRPLRDLNGVAQENMPLLKPEQVAEKDALALAKTLSEMFKAGAKLRPDDPAFAEVRDVMGISRQPDDQIAEAIKNVDLDADAARKRPVPAPGAPGANPTGGTGADDPAE